MQYKLDMMRLLLLTVTIVTVGCIEASPTSKLKHYHGYKVIRASPETPSHLQAIKELIRQDKYDFWREPFHGGPADVMVSPSEYSDVSTFFQKAGIPYHIMISDVESLVHEERQRKLAHQRKEADMDWDNYHTWEEINAWLSSLVDGSVDSLITSEKIGTSFEGRDMFVYKVSTGGNRTKSAFWIDANIHAREHITSAVITYMLNELVTNPSDYTDILDYVDFYFVVFMNADGFVYSHEVDRMWRKTRSNLANSTCIGVDGNRNFEMHWGEPGGASPDPCALGYHGPEPFSESETKAVRDYILNKGQNESVAWETYITLHSYSQLWLTPWGYTTQLSEDHGEQIRVASKAVAELERHFNTSYTVGNAGVALYLMSGCSQDWAKGEGGFKYAATVELRDTGRYGFLLPAEQIIDTSVETWAAVQVVAKDMAENRKQSSHRK